MRLNKALVAGSMVAFLFMACGEPPEHAGAPLPDGKVASAISTGLVISQVYGAGGNGGALVTNDYIELYNRGASTVSLAGMSVQDASAAGTTWSVTAIAGSLAPGQHYLVQEFSGGAVGAPLPTPDATGAINMAAGAGKVALVNGTVALSGGCPAGTIDLIGYGAAATCFETATAPAPSPTLADLRGGAGCVETDNNATDFATGAPNPRNTATAILGCPLLGAGSALPNPVGDDGRTLLKIVVTPATAPSSSGLAVAVDLSLIGGSATQAFVDDGTDGDLAAGDFVYSHSATLSAVSAGLKSLPFGVSDAETRSASGTLPLTVVVDATPVANTDTVTTSEDVPLTISVLANDTDADAGEPLTTSVQTSPLHGAAVPNGAAYDYSPDPQYNGPDSFTYLLLDSHGESSLGTVNITVDPVNDAPVADDESYSTAEDVALVVNAANGVLNGDTDIDGDVLQSIVLVGPTHGALALGTDGAFTYTPAGDYFGPDSFTYTVTDGALTDVGAVSLTIDAVNDLPVAGDDSYETNEDLTLVVDAPGLLGNDTDVETPGALVVSLTPVDPPDHGALTLAADGSFTYVPDGNYAGPDSFVYRISDGTDTGDATVTIDVVPVNDPPIANDDTYAVDEDQTLVTIAGVDGVLENDTDVDSFPLQATPLVLPLHGSLTLGFSGGFTYTPDPDYSGPDGFTYSVDEDAGGNDVGAVTITVNPVNDVPVAGDDAYGATEDVPTVVAAAAGLLANDTDADVGTVLVVSTLSGPTHGSLSLAADGAFTYTPASNYFGGDSFTYTADDGDGGTDTATVTLTVSAVNDVPVAVNDARSTNEDTLLTVGAPGVLGNDSDVESAITAVLGTDVSNGALALAADGSFTYMPNGNFSGTDSFTYRANDGTANSNLATVTITVNAVNDLPVANDDSYGATEDTLLSVGTPGVLGNDTDADANPLTAVLDAGPTHAASFTLNANGSFTYTPAANYDGPDSFTYHANDGTGASNVATVSITVAAFDDPPVAADDAYTVTEDVARTVAAPGVLANDTDSDSTLFASVAVAPAHGVLVLGSAGGFVYTPDANFDGTDSFTYTATGGSKTDTAVVTLTFTPVNDTPVATADAYDADEDVLLAVNQASGVLGNDSDPDSVETATLVTAPAHASAFALNADGSFTYTSAANFHGSDSFVYKAGDGASFSADTTVAITVASVNDAPVAVADAYTTIEDQPLTVAVGSGVLANDGDVDGDALTATVIVAPPNGTVDLQANGSFLYTPDADFAGDDTFTYSAEDGTGASSSITVTMTVTPVNDVPTVPVPVSPAPDATVDRDGLTFTWSAATDADGDAITYHVEVLEGGVLVAEGETSMLSLTPPGSLGKGDYTWRIEGSDAFGSSGFSTELPFSVKGEGGGGGGGGVFGCSTSGSGAPVTPAGALLAAMGIVLARRRRYTGGSPQGAPR